MIKPPTSDQQQVEKAPVGQSAGAGLTQTDKVEGVEVQDVLDEIDALFKKIGDEFLLLLLLLLLLHMHINVKFFKK